MYKRSLIVFGIFMSMFCAAIFCLDSLCNREKLYSAATNQQSYKLKISDVRGTIYDCRNIPLVNNEKKLVAAVIPCVESLNALTPAVSPKNAEYLYKKCSANAPFTIEVNKAVSCPYVKVFEVPTRYLGITLAPHIVGYLSAEKKGIFGIEKSYDSYLFGENHDICVKYNVDAVNRILPGEKELIEDKSYLKSKGVALHLDSRIQTIAEEVANKYLSRGAVIVSEVPNCEIKACLSLPAFLPQSVGNYLEDKNSPLINRTLCSFNLGSIFKLVSAAAALEKGISENFPYDCHGTAKIEDASFRCFNFKKHGEENMEQAMAHSCNGYFIELTKQISGEEILNMCKKFRLGEELILAPELSGSKGNLPSLKSLENPKTLANFSFGQGKLMSAPLQVTGLINAIASNGVYSNPKLVKGLLDEAMQFVKGGTESLITQKEKIISESTAEKLKKFMKASIDYGTSEKSRPENIEAAAKTSTAETGIIEDGKRIDQSWIAGFFPYDKPRYSVVVLSEAGTAGSENCGPVFKEITERIHSELPEFFLE